MPDLREQVGRLLTGRVCFVGLGNPHLGDDAFGVRLAESLVAAGIEHIIVAGTSPDRWIARLADPAFDHIIFLDAVELGAAPGSTILLASGDMISRFPQISTHKISLSALAQWVETNGRTKAWLLGVQPQSLQAVEGLSAAVSNTMFVLLRLICESSPKLCSSSSLQAKAKAKEGGA